MAQDPFKYFRVEARELVDQLGKGILELERTGTSAVPEMLRLAHTLKGAARVVRRPDIAEYAHAIEDALAPHRGAGDVPPRSDIDTVLGLIERIGAGLATLGTPQEAPANDGATSNQAPPAAEDLRTVFAEVGEIDTLLGGIAETRAQLRALAGVAATAGRARQLVDQLAERLVREREASNARGDRGLSVAEDMRQLVAALDRDLSVTRERLERELEQVRDAAEQLRLVSAGSLFPFLERVARDAAQATGKLVAFESRGGDLRLDSHMLRVIHEALVQLVRNAVAHGIEGESERRRLGKSGKGRVAVEVSRRGRAVVFRCRDDGRGIDLDAVRRAALRRAMSPSEVQAMDERGLVEFLLKGGFSTASSLSQVAGRGVGMEVVRSAVARVGGTLSATSEAGKGMTFELTVPLTLAAAEALLVVSGGHTVAIPFEAVKHVATQAATVPIVTQRAREMLYDGRAIPVAALTALLGEAPDKKVGGVIVVEGDGRLAAVEVERLSGTAGIVFRSLPAHTPAADIIAGASLDADGNPQLMLDPASLVKEAERAGVVPGVADAGLRPILVIDDSLTTRMLEQSILESAGYDVDLATSAEEGLEAARRKSYGLFLVDVEMPGMDGFSFIQRVRGDAELRDTPAILVTSRNDPADVARGKEVGAQDYVIKSEFDQAHLLARIRELAG